MRGRAISAFDSFAKIGATEINVIEIEVTLL